MNMKRLLLVAIFAIASIGNAATLTLSWADNSANEDGFRAEQAIVTAGTPGPWIEVNSVAANVTTTDVEVVFGEYQFRVVAFNAFGDSGPSNVVSVDVNVPNPPGPVIINVGTIQVGQMNVETLMVARMRLDR